MVARIRIVFLAILLFQCVLHGSVVNCAPVPAEPEIEFTGNSLLDIFFSWTIIIVSAIVEEVKNQLAERNQA